MAWPLQFWRAFRADLGGHANPPVEVDEDNPLPVRTMGPAADLPAIVDLGGGSFFDRSLAIAAANVAQDLFAPNIARRFLFIQIPTAGSKVWIAFGKDATSASPSIELLPGDPFSLESYLCTQRVSVICATAGAAVTAWEG